MKETVWKKMLGAENPFQPHHGKGSSKRVGIFSHRAAVGIQQNNNGALLRREWHLGVQMK